MLTRLSITFFLLLSSAHASKVETRGDCSPAITSNEGGISVNCYINDLPLDSIVRKGRAIDLIGALDSGISAETILQGFVLGNVKSLSGSVFFKKVKLDDLTKLLTKLTKQVNVNNKIYISNDAYTTLFWLAADSQRKEVISMLAKLGASTHTRDHRHGGQYDVFVTKEFFPLISLIREGAVSTENVDILEELFENSFTLPEFNVEKESGIIMPVRGSNSNEFLEYVALRKKITRLLPKAKSRKPFDMANIPKLCKVASESDDFDWCERLGLISTHYLVNEKDKSPSHWPNSIKLIGLMDINSDYAIFLMQHDRGWGNIGQFYAPRKGKKFIFRYWNTDGSNNTPCWNDRLGGYKTDCWRSYSYEQDIFDKRKIIGKRGYPTYIASETKIVIRR